jgi:hypothetical protein
MKSREPIARYHDMLRYGLDILEGMVKKMEGGERIEIADAMAILKYLRVLQEESPSGPPDGTMLILGLEDALRGKRGTDFVRKSRLLGLTLRSGIEQNKTIRAQEQVTIPDALYVDPGLSRLGKKYAPAGPRLTASLG